MSGHEKAGQHTHETEVVSREQLRCRELADKVRMAIATFPRELLAADRNTAQLQTANKQWVRIFFLGDYRFLPASADLPTGLFIGSTDEDDLSLYEFGPPVPSPDDEGTPIEDRVETLRKLELETLTLDELELAELFLEGPSRASRRR